MIAVRLWSDDRFAMSGTRQVCKAGWLLPILLCKALWVLSAGKEVWQGEAGTKAGFQKAFIGAGTAGYGSRVACRGT